MVSQTVNKIISAEKQAADKVDSANKKAASIVSEANQRAKDIMDEATRDAAAESERLMQINKIKIEGIIAEHKITPDENTAIRDNANSKKDSALDIVIKIITKQ